MVRKYVIYKVTNQVNGKMYIGKTYDLQMRKREHLSDINDNLPFHNAIKKYGIENFSWEIVDYAYNDKDARLKETQWIKKLNTAINAINSNGYNITLGGEGGISWNSKVVVQFDLNGKYIDEFVSSQNAAISVGCASACISRACKSERHYSNGYMWLYKDEWDGKTLPHVKNRKGSRSFRRIVQLDQKGQKIQVFDSIKEATSITHASRTSIVACAKGKIKRAGGYIWVYQDEYDSNKDYSFKGIQSFVGGIVQLDDNMQIVNRFANCSDAARFLNEPVKTHKQIFKALSNNKRCRGYYWRKYTDYIKTQHGNTEVIN